MATPFERSLRSLRRDGHGRSVVGVIVALALMGAWIAWLTMAEANVYESSADARLETEEPPRAVEAPVDGRVVGLEVALGDRVEEGDVLLRLESTQQRLELDEARTRVRALSAQIDPLRSEIEATEERIDQGVSGAREAVREARAQRRAAEAAVSAARERSEAMRRLAPRGAASRLETSDAEARARTTESAAEAAAFAVERIRWSRLLDNSDQRARLEALRRELARILGEIETASAAVERLEHEVRERVVVAPCAGHVADLSDLARGSYVQAGEAFASILPPGQLRVVAYFPPSEAFGRIRPGQTAQMRLDGFPWTRFGTLATRVDRVAEERRTRGVRVELALVDADGFAAPLEHGLPGSIEIVVERLSPFELALRAAGQLLSSARVAPPTESQDG